MLCVLYVIAVGTLLGVVGLLLERVMPQSWPRRWMWCGVMGLSVTLPGIYRARHASAVASIDQSFWAKVDSADILIQRFWLSASALLIVWGLLSAWRVFRVISASRSRRDARMIVDGVPVVVTDSAGPATVGVLRSRVLVPKWVLALPVVQRRYVVRHEEEHRRAHDSGLLFVASLALLLVPWNLAFWWQLRRLSLAIEMDCDNRVVAALGNPDAYGELLLKVAQAASRGPRFQPAFLGAGMLERRLTVLLAPTQLRRAQQFLLPAAAIALLFLVFTMPHPILDRGSHAHMATATAPQR